MKLLITGQSNAEMIEDNQDAVNELLTIFSGVEFSAFGGSALLKKNASLSTPSNYWLNVNSLGEIYNGPRMVETLTDLGTCGKNVVLWIQGEQDSTRINTLDEAQEYKAGLIYLFDQFLQYCDLVVTVTIGRRLANYDDGIHLVRVMTQQVANEMPSVELMADNYPLALRDHVHYTDQAQIDLCRDLTDSITQYLSSGIFDIGAKASSVKRYSRDVDVTFNQTVTSVGSRSYKLFSIRDKNGNLLQSPVSITQLSVLKVRLHFSSQPQKQYLCVGVGQLVAIDTDPAMKIICSNGKPLSPSMVRIS